MDAVEFLRERRRMCNYYEYCEGCPLDETECVVSNTTSSEDCERIITAVKQWSKEHPHKTRQSVFLGQWPNAELDCEGVIAIDLCDIDKTMYGKYSGCSNGDCGDCSREFWMQEVE